MPIMNPPNPEKKSLREWQAEVRTVLAPVAHPRLGAALALAEETGECMQAVMALEIYGNETGPGHLGQELADTLVALLELANHYNLDLESLMTRHLETLRGKTPGWERDFGAALAKRRKQLDADPPES